MTTLPTWHGQPAALNDISGIDVEAFGMVFAAMRGKSWCNSTKDDALHLLEAGAHLGLMAYWADRQGYRLEKSRLRDRHALGFDTWQLVNEKTGDKITGDNPDVDGNYGLTLDQVHVFLTKRDTHTP
jgi:hypothetical protein